MGEKVDYVVYIICLISKGNKIKLIRLLYLIKLLIVKKSMGKAESSKHIYVLQ